MYGINAPESRTRDLEEKKRGLAAKDRLTELLDSDDITIRTSKDKTGKFGRILGKFLIYDKKTDREMTLNEWLVREHHAVEYHGQSKEDIAEQHIINRGLVE